VTATEREILRRLYREACFGAGADVRRSARASLEAMVREAGTSLRAAFEEERLDLAAYFATRPIAAQNPA
jgi:hypothetical protein